MLPRVGQERRGAVEGLARKAIEGVKADFSAGLYRYFCTYWVLHVLCFLVWKLFSVLWSLARSLKQCSLQECRDDLGVDILPVAYEDLLADPAGTVSSVLKHCGLNGAAEDPSLRERCQEALARDSQGKSEMISREKVKEGRASFNAKTDGGEEQRRTIMDEVFRQCGLPPSRDYRKIFERKGAGGRGR